MRFIESILLRDGNYENLSLHQTRLNNVFEQFSSIDNAHRLSEILPNLQIEGTFKMRMVYEVADDGAMYDLEYAAYHPRNIETLEVVVSKPFDYSFKYHDRSHINNLLKRTNADDIIIAFDDRITDGSYFNLAFFDGSNWITPNTPLLEGVRRTHLINEGRLKAQQILVKDLSSFEKVSLINAMMDLGELEIPMDRIKV